jgi:hypothetical protein
LYLQLASDATLGKVDQARDLLEYDRVGGQRRAALEVALHILLERGVCCRCWHGPSLYHFPAGLTACGQSFSQTQTYWLLCRSIWATVSAVSASLS